MKQTVKQKFQKLCLIAVSSLLVGCFDTGFPDTEAYFNSFDDSVRIIHQEGINIVDNSISFKEKLFNDEIVNDFNNVDDLLEKNAYTYMGVKINEGFELDDLVFYIKCEDSIVFHIQIYLTKAFPVAFRLYDDPIPGTILPDGNPAVYADDLKDPIVDTSKQVDAEKWEDFFIEDWNDKGLNKSFLKLETGQYLLFRFKNNTAYGRDVALNKVDFMITDFIASLHKAQ